MREIANLMMSSHLSIIIFVSALLVFLMQPGFMLLEAGSVSRKNAVNNIFKNFVDVFISGIFFWAIGFDIVTGNSQIISFAQEFGFAKPPNEAVVHLKADETILFFYNFAFAATCVTITSGAVTGRISPFAYSFFAIFFVSLIYPSAAFSVWHERGILFGVLHDFAGGVVVHTVGAAAGLAGALLLRPRIGFNGYDPFKLGVKNIYQIAASHAPHNIPLFALGVFLLWIGWYGFNGGSVFSRGFAVGATAGGQEVFELFQLKLHEFGRVIVNTTVAPSSAALFVICYSLFRDRDLDIFLILNGALAGLVAITACADAVGSVSAIGIGAISGAIFLTVKTVMLHASIDDPVSAFSVHGVTGIFGAACIALKEPTVALGIGVAVDQIACGLAIFGFSFLTALITFQASHIFIAAWRLLKGRCSLKDAFKFNFIRVSYELELEGIDKRLHGQDAYNFEAKD